MSEPLYVARSKIEKVDGVHRRAHLESGQHFDVGVHGAIKKHFNLVDAKDLPLPVDYIAAATGA
jgi:hypothetical protein